MIDFLQRYKIFSIYNSQFTIIFVPLHKYYRLTMKKTFIIALFCSLMTACGEKTQPQEAEEAISIQQNLPGDLTYYGLACDGSTDSILVLLPNKGGDPDTLNIINAFQKHRLYGRPHIGDQLAVILGKDSTDEVESVINMTTLQGEWHYLITPTLHHQLQNMPPLPDSVRQRIMVPHEHIIRLKNGGVAFSIGDQQRTKDYMSPVEYPKQKRYTQWQLFNGRLILKGDTASHEQPDTADILLLRQDSLVLRFNDHEQAYFKKK